MDNEITLRQVWDGWEWSHVPGASIRGFNNALRMANATPAEIWTLSISQRTLAKGERLMHYVCTAKVVNNLPRTPEEEAYLNLIVKNKYHQ